MHALLVSGSIGMGHDVMAEACADALVDRGWTTDIVDGIRLLGDRSSGVGERVFRAMLAVPGVYDAFHFEQLRAGGRLAVLAERTSSKYLVPALEAELDKRPTDLLVSVFATAAGAAGRLKDRYPGMRTAVFCTDVCPHRVWIHESTDLYLVTSEAARAFVRRFHPRAEVAVVPAPARASFYAAPTQPDARAELGIPQDARCVLLMAGSWGIGPLREIATRLAAAGIFTIAVAGRNAALGSALRSAAAHDPKVLPFGFTHRIPTLMSASDLVITTPGDTCTEARVIGRHMLLLDVVPGHGRENLQHELEQGGADVAPGDPAGLLRAALACLDRVAKPPTRVVGSPDAWWAAFGEALARVGLADADPSS
jgi:UDP-N-acetylglucosamine:LPS N-acetylglucosamine transferase